MQFTFNSKIKTVGKISPIYNTHQISTEPMLFSTDLEFAKEHGGLLTNHVLDALLNTKEFVECYNRNPNIVIDTRSTMTIPGSYPSIPGWHCDDLPRVDRHSQPDLNAGNNSVQHFMVLLSDEHNVSRTEFVTDPRLTVDIDPDNVWNSLDAYIESHDDVRKGFLNEGDIIQFNQYAIHRASICKTAGWRYFFRLSLTHRKPKNEIRKQVQVYVTSNGW